MLLASDDPDTEGLLPVDRPLRTPVADADLADAIRRGVLTAEQHRAVGRFAEASADRATAGTTDPLAEVLQLSDDE